MGRAATTVTRGVVGVGAAALLGGALLFVPGGAGTQPAAAVGLVPFEGCDELRSWFADAARAHGAYGPGRGDAPVMEGSERALASPADAPPEASTGVDSGAVGPGATGTNVQEPGVDEPDLLKTSAGRVVVVRDDRLYVVDVTGQMPRALGSVTLPGGVASELLLSGDRALVLGSSWATTDPVSAKPAEPPPADQNSALLTVVDLATPSRPTVVTTHEVEGTYLSAREHDGVARVVLQATPVVATPTPAEDWLPQHIERDASRRIIESKPLVDCADVRHPADPSGVGLVTVLTLDLHDPAVLQPVTVATDGDLVYASTDRLYVATTRGGWVMRDATMPSDAAERNGVRTGIHAFDVTDRADTAYVASGEVDGWLMGRWAMSEYEGLLRAATTRGGQWSGNGDAPDTDAAVTVLEERGDRLDAVGSVGGLGQGEQVRAVRWFGDVATVVTFRQTDPLYTVDLADPTQPRVLGELKVPGYSAYLHPLGDRLLLGIGQDATAQGRVLGTQVSTFDLSDLAAPVPVDTVVEARSYSEVETDSRQFSYLPELRTAVLPIMSDIGSTLWSLRVGEDGVLEETGRWAPDRTGHIMRALPVEGGRLAVLHNATLTMVTAQALTELGSVRLP